MHVSESVELSESLQEMWKSHREYLRRMLIGLARDIDLADDLLQETYLRAEAGISGFRGGDARAWLATIARNAFLMHIRRPHVGLETSLDEDTLSRAVPSPDSADRLLVMELRQAVGALSPGLRSALIMKHYGGFTYKEIADRLNCAPATAKWRVRTALEQLRVALGEFQKERPEMKCDELKGLRILDHLYGALPADEVAEVERHLEECAVCYKEADDLHKVVVALETLQGDHKMMNIDELDAAGAPTVYGSTIGINESKSPAELLEFESDKTCSIDYLSALGEELQFEKTQSELSEYRFHYKAHLPRPVQPGESMDMLAVCHVADEMNAVELEKGRWRYHRMHTPSSNQEFVYVQAVRLPCGARFLTADPKPDEIRANGTTTLVWRRLLAPNQQFESTVEYTF
ncbi:MAG: sigma-70 family RNA polymerase sigma factor [Armatimonadetes bacterium]|nr:sigma-70 family RNA polymerase sigma factor [Armatimonadota bacterium]